MSEISQLTDQIQGMRNDLTSVIEKIADVGSKQAAAEVNHTWVSKHLDTHSARLNRHSDRIDILESSNSTFKTSTRINEWGIRLLIGSAMSIVVVVVTELIRSGVG